MLILIKKESYREKSAEVIVLEKLGRTEQQFKVIKFTRIMLI